MSQAAFDQQMANAKRRNVPFLFSYEEWVAWWVSSLGPDWQQKRGCKKGQYCMARIGDRGAYEPSNVKCILHGENVSDAALNNVIAFGEASGHAVLTASGARDIFLSKESRIVLAARYGITIATITDIRARRTWRRATTGLVRENLLGRNQWK